MEIIHFFIFLIVIVVTCKSSFLPIFNSDETQNGEGNSQNIKVYDYGIPSNLKELYDIQNGNVLPMAKIKYINYKQSSNITNIGGKAITSQKAFNFNIKTPKNAESEIYEKALLHAEEIISNAIEIKKTINVDVYIEDFCDSLQNIQCTSLVGMTYAPLYIALKDGPNEREYAYPQALTKQLNLNKAVDFADHDLIVYLNTKMAKDDYSDLIVTHEILHGLGIMGNGVVIGKSIGMNDMDDEFFSPYVYYDLEENNKKYNYHLLGFLPFTVYEKHIVSLKDPETYLCRSGFEEFYQQSINITSYSLNAMSSANDQFSVLTDIYKEIYNNNKSTDRYREIAKLYKTLNSVGFKSSDGEVITLQTFNNKYLSSSSICHIAVPYKCDEIQKCFSENIEDYDPNFLMYFYYPIQFKTSSMINRFNNKYGLIGPKIMKILTTIGWTEKGKPEDEKTYYVTNDQFPDVYDNLFEIKANNKISNKKESYLVSESIKLNSHFIGVFVIILLSLYVIHN
ncbi:hypothetical protein PIROE2DRAFT_63423 [Piromyces sp. E2]|nr:hypothetical protein PIROE2DRAFT_63423 [Piromyces sp. E2]|eukprot:OUM59980.1 hypothetical protein PIROE2DRAFT_63423 [Piromyces sp. E2]